MACRIRYYEYQVDVDFLAPWQQIPVNVSHKSSESVTSIQKRIAKVFYLEIPLVAFRINWAISVGWDTSEAWLEGSAIVVAFICFANIRSTAGGIAWSYSDTSYHVGLDVRISQR
jgi:hypothetical protein